jgi:hypothetical protein
MTKNDESIPMKNAGKTPGKKVPAFAKTG